jgi:ribose transport system substrate-binding protein
MVVTVFQDAKAQATGAVRVAYALINKQKTDNYHWIPYQTVTRTNYEQFIQQNQK